MNIRKTGLDEAFVELAGEWDDLARGGMSDTPFQYYAYQKSWWKHLGKGEGMALAARDGAGALQGIAPFYLYDETLFLNGAVEESDYLDIIAASEAAEAVWKAILIFLNGKEAPKWQHIELSNVPAASPTRQFVPQIAEQIGYRCEMEIQEVCPVISLPANFDDYLSGLGKRSRHETRRKLRRAKGAEAEMVTVQPTDDLTAEVDAFLTLLKQSTPEKRAWLNAGRQALFQDVAKWAQDAGMLQLQFLEIEGEKASALFNFVYRNRVWVYNSGLDSERFGWLGAGSALTAMSIEENINAGISEYDFLRGNEGYKYDFGAEDSLVYRLRISRK